MNQTDIILKSAGDNKLLIDKNADLIKQDYLGQRKKYLKQDQIVIPQSDKISAYVGDVKIQSNYNTSENNTAIWGMGGGSFTLLVGDYDGGRNSKKTTYTYIKGDSLYLQGYTEANFYYGNSSSNGLKINSSGLKYKGHDLNSASGLVQLDGNGKVPSGLITPQYDGFTYAGLLTYNTIPWDNKKMYYVVLPTGQSSYVFQQVTSSSKPEGMNEFIIGFISKIAGASISVTNAIWKDPSTLVCGSTAPSITVNKVTYVKFTFLGTQQWVGQVMYITDIPNGF